MRWRFWLHPFFSNNLFEWFSKFSFSNKIENQAERSLKSLCDKSVKNKNVIRSYFFSVRDDRRGIWLFSRRHYSRSINLLTSRNDFQDFQNFHFLTKSKIKPSDRSKVCVNKVWKRTMWSDQILCLSETIVVVFDFFPEDTIQGP